MVCVDRHVLGRNVLRVRTSVFGSRTPRPRPQVCFPELVAKCPSTTANSLDDEGRGCEFFFHGEAIVPRKCA